MTTRRAVLAAGMTGAVAAVARRAGAVPLTYAIRPLPVADGIWMVAGADAPILAANGGAIANITIIATDAGTILIDAGPSLRYGEALKAVATALTGKPVVRVYLTHLHPDHVLGQGAFDPSVVSATPGLTAALAREGRGFSDAMYRLLGDWMRGTDIVAPGRVTGGDAELIGNRRLRLYALSGHSESDLALLDEATGTLIAGDLVFHQRAPATPHAQFDGWRAALDTLRGIGHRRVVPGHGPIDPGPTGAIAQTRDWLDWLDGALNDAIDRGLDMVEAGAMPIPARFAGLAAARYELQRSVAHFYPAREAARFPLLKN